MRAEHVEGPTVGPMFPVSVDPRAKMKVTALQSPFSRSEEVEDEKPPKLPNWRFVRGVQVVRDAAAATRRGSVDFIVGG